MAASADFRLQEISTDSNVPKMDSPPGYYPVSQHVHTGTPPQFIGVHTAQPTTMGTTVVVTQPVVTQVEPNTTCPLVMSVLTVVLCFSVCGMAGIFAAWKARLDVLGKKYEQASHSVKIAWLFFALAIYFWLLPGIIAAIVFSIVF
ncbi:uncharacterized protein LOC112577298 isoform X2 [Pomacea canaliculata]|uniref:uncharacterized protein LOC112577298 isoform X2 n=1 Tax=Pomacea canaliculata TaxID=400727 RepID=UPI000D727158|nr:uncharacterized protein LOC112577298 isoform X2 [Pomacea canaliculata]